MLEKWKILIDLVWTCQTYWELVNQYKESQPQGAFFYLSWFALRNELLMKIAHTIILCEQIATQIDDIGANAKIRLDELMTLYKQGETKDRAVIDFEDCGLQAFRDKVLAHPLNRTKRVLGKEEYRISLHWDTVADTLEKIRQFCAAVEAHKRGEWQTTHYLDETGDGSNALKEVMSAIEQSEKYHRLRLKLLKRPRPPHITYDWQTHEFILHDDGQ